MTRVLIAVGHGRRPNGTLDPGASAGGGRTEQSEGQRIGEALVPVLRGAGVTVEFIPRGGPNWQGAADRANLWGADYAIELHHDWSGAPRGAFGHWHSFQPQAAWLADRMRDRLMRDLRWPIRHGWHRARNELGWVRTCKMPAVLWECDRIGEVVDHRAYGEALARGVLDFLGIEEDDDMPSVQDIWSYRRRNRDGSPRDGEGDMAFELVSARRAAQRALEALATGDVALAQAVAQDELRRCEAERAALGED